MRKKKDLSTPYNRLRDLVNTLTEYLLGMKIKGEIIRIENDSVTINKSYDMLPEIAAPLYYGRREINASILSNNEEIPVKIILERISLEKDQVLSSLHERCVSYGSIIYGRTRSTKQPYSIREPKIVKGGIGG